MKRISIAAWRQLVEHHRGGPELSSDRMCMACARESLAAIAASSEQEMLRVGARAMLMASEGEAAAGFVPTEGYYVSKLWLQCVA